MKRYKVVQDARGYWGIWDRENEDFASWGDGSWAGAECLDEIIHYAGELNAGVSVRGEFSWDGKYLPREEA